MALLALIPGQGSTIDLFRMYQVTFEGSPLLVVGPTTFAGETGRTSNNGSRRNFLDLSWVADPAVVDLRRNPRFRIAYEWSRPAAAPYTLGIQGVVDTIPVNQTGLFTTAPGVDDFFVFESTGKRYPDAIGSLADKNPPNWGGGIWSANRGQVARSDVVPGGQLYFTFGRPKSDAGVVTEKRVGWLTETAKGARTDEEAADKIHAAIGGNDGDDGVDRIPFNTGDGLTGIPAYKPNASWELLDGTCKGECDEHALLMARSMRMLGVDATVVKVHASTDADVLIPEQKLGEDGFPLYLVMDFPTTGVDTHDWNIYEGACLTAGKCYAVWPAVKADSPFDLYNTLSFRQFWVNTVGDTAPGDETSGRSRWGVRQIVGEVPKFSPTSR